ncbi:MAG TPA: IS200/IS605 family transposase [Ktedonobacterales bacterium]|nr:IS200/IS605 family transposase [Ktedonobacterales bacterium]
MRQTRVGVFVHLVWATWDRLPLLVGERQRTVYRAIEHKCVELGAEIIALGGVEDHIHLLLRMPPTHSIANLVGQIKGASSHLATHVAATAADRDFFKWQGAYGAFSVSAPALPTVSAYIAHQREHHADGTMIAAYEPDPRPTTPTTPAPSS